jgi:hypothetical protein
VVRLHPLPRRTRHAATIQTQINCITESVWICGVIGSARIFTPRGESSSLSRSTTIGFRPMAGRQALNLDMGVRPSRPELQPTEAQVNRRFPEHELIAERQRHGVTGRDNRIRRRARRSRPRDPCLCSSNAEQPVLTRTRVGSSPTGGTMRTRPLGAALRFRRSSGRFEPCRPLHQAPAARRSCRSSVNCWRRFDSDRGLDQ